jgi:hypothetical protein
MEREPSSVRWDSNYRPILSSERAPQDKEQGNCPTKKGNRKIWGARHQCRFLNISQPQGSTGISLLSSFLVGIIYGVKPDVFQNLSFLYEMETTLLESEVRTYYHVACMVFPFVHNRIHGLCPFVFRIISSLHALHSLACPEDYLWAIVYIQIRSTLLWTACDSFIKNNYFIHYTSSCFLLLLLLLLETKFRRLHSDSVFRLSAASSIDADQHSRF